MLVLESKTVETNSHSLLCPHGTCSPGGHGEERLHHKYWCGIKWGPTFWMKICSFRTYQNEISRAISCLPNNFSHSPNACTCVLDLHLSDWLVPWIWKPWCVFYIFSPWPLYNQLRSLNVLSTILQTLSLSPPLPYHPILTTIIHHQSLSLATFPLLPSHVWDLSQTFFIE